jgi:hypothetical protein
VVLLVFVAAIVTCWEVRQEWKKVFPRGRICDRLSELRTNHIARKAFIRAAIPRGLARSLPLMLIVTFTLVPSTSMRIFETFLCDSFEYDPSVNDTRRYLHHSLDLSCNSRDYEVTRNTALVTLGVWPIGVPLLYAMLLWLSRKAILSGAPTTLSRATAFLYGDYDEFLFWWEPLEMCRKLILSTAT